jgi:predicted secreted Zn-dependent protease
VLADEALILSAALLACAPAAAIESQAQGAVEALPAQVRQVFTCGEWSAAGERGHHRVVIVDVSGGAGSEVYLQRVQQREGHAGAEPRVLETTPVRELNNDHTQYSVTSARCIAAGARSTVELIATFEHDSGDVRRRIRIVLTGGGPYRLVDTVLLPPRTPRSATAPPR